MDRVLSEEEEAVLLSFKKFFSHADVLEIAQLLGAAEVLALLSNGTDPKEHYSYCSYRDEIAVDKTEEDR